MAEIKELYGTYTCLTEEQCGVVVNNKTKSDTEIIASIQAMQSVCHARTGDLCSVGCDIRKLKEKILSTQRVGVT